jgi:hypothetical protein
MVCCRYIFYHLQLAKLYNKAVYVLTYRYSLKMDTDKYPKHAGGMFS